MKKPAKIAIGYLSLVALLIGYELSIRIYNPAHSELAGMWSTFCTLPSSALVMVMMNTYTSWRVGNSNEEFIATLGLAALINAGLIYLLARWILGRGGPSRKKKK